MITAPNLSPPVPYPIPQQSLSPVLAILGKLGSGFWRKACDCMEQDKDVSDVDGKTQTVEVSPVLPY